MFLCAPKIVSSFYVSRNITNGRVQGEREEAPTSLDSHPIKPSKHYIVHSYTLLKVTINTMTHSMIYITPTMMNYFAWLGKLHFIISQVLNSRFLISHEAMSATANKSQHMCYINAPFKKNTESEVIIK